MCCTSQEQAPEMAKALTHIDMLAIESKRALGGGMPSELGAMGFPEMRMLSNKMVAELRPDIANVSNMYKCRDGNSAANVTHSLSLKNGPAQ